MKELDDELWMLGVPAKTKHNEVAPAQHASGSPWMSSLPEKVMMAWPSEVGSTKASCFSEVMPESGWKPTEKEIPMTNVPEIYGSLVFNESTMRERLPKATYKQLMETIKEGAPLAPEVANVVAHAMKEWAIEKGPVSMRSMRRS